VIRFLRRALILLVVMAPLFASLNQSLAWHAPADHAAIQVEPQDQDRCGDTLGSVCGMACATSGCAWIAPVLSTVLPDHHIAVPPATSFSAPASHARAPETAPPKSDSA
jgi:hypothetical protein